MHQGEFCEVIGLMGERCKPFLHWDFLWNTDFADLFCSCLGSVAAYVVPRSARFGLNINCH